MPIDSLEEPTEVALPTETWANIFSFIDNNSLFKTNQVNTFFNMQSKNALFSRKGVAALQLQKRWYQGAIDAKSKNMTEENLGYYLKNPTLTASERAKALHFLAEKKGITLQIDKEIIEAIKERKFNLRRPLDLGNRERFQKILDDMLPFMSKVIQAQFVEKKIEQTEPIIDEEASKAFSDILSSTNFNAHPDAEKLKAMLLMPFQSQKAAAATRAYVIRETILQYFTSEDIVNFITHLPSRLNRSNKATEVVLDFLILMTDKLTAKNVPFILPHLLTLLDSRHASIRYNSLRVLGDLKPIINQDQFAIIFPEVLELLHDQDITVCDNVTETLTRLLKNSTVDQRAFFLKKISRKLNSSTEVRQAILDILTRISGDLTQVEVDFIYPILLAELDKEENACVNTLISLLPKLHNDVIFLLFDQIFKKKKTYKNRRHLLAALIPRIDTERVSLLLNEIFNSSYDANMRALYQSILAKLTETQIQDFVNNFESHLQKELYLNPRVFLIHEMASLLTPTQLSTILYAAFAVNKNNPSDSTSFMVLKKIAPFLKDKIMRSVMETYFTPNQEHITPEAIDKLISAVTTEQANMVFTYIKLQFADNNFYDHRLLLQRTCLPL